MEGKNYLKPVRFLFLLVCGTGLLISCSKDNDNLPTQTAMEIAKTDFSHALKEWNNPKNFTLRDGKTNQDLLRNRLILIQDDAVNLLLASGKTKEETRAMNLEQKFLTALDVFTKNNLKN